MQPVQQQIQQQPIAAQDGPPVLPNLSPQEQAEMNRMIQQSCAEAGIPASNPAPQGDLYARIGAPPFPLNLVPEQAMKGFIKGARDRKPIAPKPQSFGSWHGDMAGPVASGLPTALPAAGFRSYSQMGNGFKKYSRVPAQLSHKHQSSHSHKSHSSIAHSVPKVNRGIARRPKSESPSISMAQVTVYEYPPYHSDLHLDAR